MDLKDVKNHDDILQLYNEKNLTSIKEKIDYLKDTMGVLKSKCEQYELTSEDELDELLGLEDLALTHMWEALSN